MMLMRGPILALALAVLGLAAAGASAGEARAQGSTTLRSDALRPEGGAASDLNQLHDALRLSAAQETAWRAYAQALAAGGDVEARRRAASEMMPRLPTPRRIALMQAEMAAEQADLKRTSAAVLAFYGQLTPAQQQVFDRQTLPREAAGESGGR